MNKVIGVILASAIAVLAIYGIFALSTNNGIKIVEKEVMVQFPKYQETICFLYPTYVTYPIVGGDSQAEWNKQVWIVIKAEPSKKIAKYETLEGKEIKTFGYFVEVSHGEYTSDHNWMEASQLEQLKTIPCNHFGEVFPRIEK